MSVFPGPYNAVCYAQFNLQGGWRRLLSIASAYGVLIGIAIWLSSMNQHHRQSVEMVQGWLGGLFGLQILILLVYGSYRVDAAVRGDVTSRMIESHRVMPASPLGSILGYIFGGPLQALMVGVANVLLGLGCCTYTGMRGDMWLLLNGVLLLFALTIYAMLAQFALLSRGGFLLALILGAVVTASGGNDVLRVVPAMIVLTAPLVGQNSAPIAFFDSIHVGPHALFAYTCALAGLAGVAMISIRIAIRRYRSAAVIGISAVLGLLLLGLWTAISFLYLRFPDSFPGFRNYNNSEMVHTQVVATFATCFLLAVLPIASAARAADQLRRTHSSISETGNSFAQLWVPAAAGGIICATLCVVPVDIGSAVTAVLSTLAIVWIYVIGISCLITWSYLVRRTLWAFLLLWIAITWIGPIGADAIYRVTTDSLADATQITGCSPVGALALVWSGSGVSVIPGIGVQAMAALLPAGLMLIVLARRRRKVISPPPGAVESQC